MAFYFLIFCKQYNCSTFWNSLYLLNDGKQMLQLNQMQQEGAAMKRLSFKSNVFCAPVMMVIYVQIVMGLM